MLPCCTRPWIVHFCPKYIEVLTFAIKAQFVGQAELEMELFDAVVHRFKQVDDDLYSHEGHLRWRHFVESDFMVCMQSLIRATSIPFFLEV
jgi:hypothetical protein